MNIQWFPGHMTKTKRQIEEKLKLIDAVVEILDARIPVSSQNPDITEITGGKPRVIVLNKVDLADENTTKLWAEYFKKSGAEVCYTDCEKGKGVKETINAVKRVLADKIASDTEKGMNRAIKILVVGVPNVGKSSYINRLSGRSSATVGDRPGVTRGQQWIRLKNGVELLDTPGILWPKFEDKRCAYRLAATGAIKNDVLDIQDIAIFLLEYLTENYPEAVAEKYGIKKENIKLPTDYLELCGRRRGCLVKGGEVDMYRAAGIALDDFRSGKLGKITLDGREMLEAPEVEND